MSDDEGVNEEEPSTGVAVPCEGSNTDPVGTTAGDGRRESEPTSPGSTIALTVPAERPAGRDGATSERAAWSTPRSARPCCSRTR
jgi:hypothetical protein